MIGLLATWRGRGVAALFAVVAMGCSGSSDPSTSTFPSVTTTSISVETTSSASATPATTSTDAVAATTTAVPPLVVGVPAGRREDATLFVFGDVIWYGAGGGEGGAVEWALIDASSGDGLGQPQAMLEDAYSIGAMVAGHDPASDYRLKVLDGLTGIEIVLPQMDNVAISPDGGELWGSVFSEGRPGVLMVDLDTLEERFFAVPALTIAVGNTYVWAADGRGLQRLDPDSGESSFVVDFPDPPGGIPTTPVLTDGRVVLTELFTQNVYVHDIASGDTTAIVPQCPIAPCTASSEFMIAPTDDSPFVVGRYLFFRNRYNGRLVRIDPEAAIAEEFDFGLAPGPGVSHDGINLWWGAGGGVGGVFNWHRVDPESMELLGSVTAGLSGSNAFPEQVAAWVWAPTNEGLLQFDATDLILLRRWDGITGKVLSAGGRFWVSCPKGDCLMEISP